jgi:hypothetical protein
LRGGGGGGGGGGEEEEEEEEEEGEEEKEEDTGTGINGINDRSGSVVHVRSVIISAVRE